MDPTTVSRNAYIYKHPEVVKQCNCIIHRIIEMKPIDVKPKACIDSPAELNETKWC